MKIVSLYPKERNPKGAFYFNSLETCLLKNKLNYFEKIGVITVIGEAEAYDLRFTDVHREAKQVDGIAVNFDPTVTFPDSDRLYDPKARVAVEKIFDHEFLYQAPLLLRQFILGIEVQLGRRVITAGSSKKWLVVPANHNDRHQAPQVSDNELANLIVDIWNKNEGEIRTVQMFQYLKEMNRYTTDLDQITRVYNAIRTTGNLGSEDNT